VRIAESMRCSGVCRAAAATAAELAVIVTLDTVVVDVATDLLGRTEGFGVAATVACGTMSLFASAPGTSLHHIHTATTHIQYNSIKKQSMYKSK
jgi:hypothetical protein